MAVRPRKGRIGVFVIFRQVQKQVVQRRLHRVIQRQRSTFGLLPLLALRLGAGYDFGNQIGRASCRERVSTDV